MKILTVLGARPQFIKAATCSRAFRDYPHVREILLHTGQHYDDNMSQIFFDQLGIPAPSYNLGIGSAAQGAQTGRMLEKIEGVMLDEKPDMVLVYGDTNSTLSGALAAAKLHIPVAHVEAGLRSGNRAMPEELNRVLTDHTADLLFAPTEEAVRNLRHEGIADSKRQLVGDVMYDATLFFLDKAGARSNILAQLRLQPKNYFLATLHRAENTDDPERLRGILGGLARASKDTTIVLPLHPRTRAAIAKDNKLEALSRHCRIIEPVGYLDMVVLEQSASLIATDSGGVQKEAFFHRVPCVTLRDETEWIELIDHGFNRLAGSQESNILDAITEMMVANPDWSKRLYGEGNAANQIAEYCINQLK